MALPKPLEYRTPPHGVSLRMRVLGRETVSIAAAVTATTILALALRWMTVGAQSAWLDEGYSLSLAHHSMSYVLDFTRNYDLHPPLYYIVLNAWLHLSGFGIDQGRALSVLFGALTVPAMFALGVCLFDRATGLLAALLVAVSPVIVWYSHEARMYALVVLLTTCALVAAAVAVRHPGRGLSAWAAYVVFAALAFYADYSAAYVLVAVGIWTLITLRHNFRSLRSAALAHVGLGLILLPALVLLYGQTRNVGGVAWIPMPTATTVASSVMDLVAMYDPVPAFTMIAFVLLGLLGLLAALIEWPDAWMRHAYGLAIFVFVTPLAIPLVLSVFQPAFLTRTVLTSVIGMILLFARGVIVSSRHADRYRVPILVGLVVPVVALALLSVQQTRVNAYNADWRSAAAYLSNSALPGDVLLFDPGFGQMPFDLYWHGTANPQRGFPADESLVHARPGVLTAPADLAALTSRAHTVWFINGAGDSLPRNSATTWLHAHFKNVGIRMLNDISVERFTNLAIPMPAASDWLDALGYESKRVQAGDVLLVNGPGSAAFLHDWAAYPHPAVSAIEYSSRTPSLTSIIPRNTRSIRFVTLLHGLGDPAAIQGGWLYHHGPQTVPFAQTGRIRLYTFAYKWKEVH